MIEVEPLLVGVSVLFLPKLRDHADSDSLRLGSMPPEKALLHANQRSISAWGSVISCLKSCVSARFAH